MIPPGSRYEDADHEFTQAHRYTEHGFPILEGTAPNLKIVVASQETTYMLGVQVDFTRSRTEQEYFVKDGENIQWLAFKFLRDPNLWWQFADANVQVWYPLDLSMGDYIHIPSNLPTT